MWSWNFSTTPKIDTTALLLSTRVASYASGGVPELQKTAWYWKGDQDEALETGARIQLGINVQDFLLDFGIYGLRSPADL
jgi:hypothetical protein